MRIESNNLIDYFVVCGLNIKSGLEPNESYGKQSLFSFQKGLKSSISTLQ